jgi:outer membrane protein
MRISTLLTALALSLASIAAPTMAYAAEVLVVDFNRVYRDSLSGKDAQNKLRALGETVARELQPEADAARTDQQALAARFQGKTEQQAAEELQKDAALRKTYDAAAAKIQAYTQKQQLRQQELQETERRAVAAVLKGADPILREMLTEKKASVVVESASTVASAPAVDITTEVIARLDTRVKAVPVTRVDLVAEQQAAQARQQAAPAAAPRR